MYAKQKLEKDTPANNFYEGQVIWNGDFTKDGVSECIGGC